MCVFEGNVEPLWKDELPCDLYLEGSDQHRGWFNVSLILGTAVRGEAPYRQVLTHGWVLDDKGRKMSKSLGNVVDPVAVSEQYGADVLRLWAASVDYTVDVACSDELLKVAGEHYRRIRNTLRYLLSNLYDYEGFDGELLDIDRWAVNATERLVGACLDAYAAYDFTKVFRLIYHFCDRELSSFYLDATKDRMYCDGADWDSRRSGQYASLQVLLRLTKLVAPILPHTAEEVYGRIPGFDRMPSVHMEVLERPDDETMEDHLLDKRVRWMLDVREVVSAQLEEWKAGAGIKDPQDVAVAVMCGPDVREALETFGDDLANYFRVASVDVSDGELGATFVKSEFEKCERSRVRRADVAPTQWNGETVPLSVRDRRALGIS